ncbi:unnamed protein product [Aspergillus oryzae]|uniref:Unnamed protein product n=1 Tax=Aspergillus oryzae var. brunneus TaxID=332754 RepID=A0ABQ6LJM8_ASPOZ|nr:unnamed protein product [Aspergillus oryzae]GMF83589.1 unnamed protein product [Aspergillus oryzae]GMG55167.1 unnamed protein product [Aspergillus oryzae var. brunneus]
MKHHLMVGTWTPPGRIYTVAFDDEALTLDLVKKTDIPEAEPISWMTFSYEPNTGIHGMVFDPTETYLYSADLQANKIWTHRKDATTGELTLVDCIDAPSPDDHPRWVEMHPSGKYLYVLMEAGLPPRNKYRGDVTFTTRSGEYLFATTRSNHFDVTGYITAFKLGPNGNIERQLFIHPTSTSGGHSNAVSPCDFSDEWLALCDDQLGFVEIYRFRDENLARVARVDIPEKGFGMNAIWYD